MRVHIGMAGYLIFAAIFHVQVAAAVAATVAGEPDGPLQCTAMFWDQPPCRSAESRSLSHAGNGGCASGCATLCMLSVLCKRGLL